MNHTNEYLELNWETDIESLPPPTASFIEPATDLDYSQGVTNLISTCGIDTIFAGALVQAEDTDLIRLSPKDGKEKVYRPYPRLWQCTADEYLRYNLYLNERLETIQDTDEWHIFTFPQLLESTFINQCKNNLVSRKNLNIPELKQHLFRISNNSDTSYNYIYKIRKLGAGVSLNYLFKELSVRSQAARFRNPIGFDGLLFNFSDEKLSAELTYEESRKIIPPFTLYDYHWHEILTGISLSIEITAILLELEDKIDNSPLWAEAFSVFCEEALPRIVRSKSIFTRISVARLYFLQIFLDETVKMYRWRNPQIPESSSVKDRTYRKALSHCDILKIELYPTIGPDDEIQLSINHLQRLLFDMKQPIDLHQLIAHPTGRLAVFCNPQHKYVSRFIKELDHLASGGTKSILKPRERKKFLEVHQHVRAAMKRGSA